MKFRWKIFFIFILLIAAVFSIFGTWMVTASFRTSLDREIERGNSENQMVQFAFEMAIDSVKEKYQFIENKVIKDIAASLKKNMSDGNTYLSVYDEDKKIIYSDSSVKADTDFIESLKDSNAGYKLLKKGDRYFLNVLCKSSTTDQIYYLENSVDITHIYEERGQMYLKYREAMLALLLGTGIITLALSYFLTNSVVSLSKITKQFSEGNYEIRAKSCGQDEIGQLAQDFNEMANRLSQKIEELSMEAKRQEDFTASFAHELKTPLTSIIGYADMLRTMQLTAEETMEASNYIYSQGKRLERLSFKLLELVVNQKQEYELLPISAVVLLEQIKTIVGESLRQKQIELIYSAEEGIIVGDRDLLTSLFINLIDNARKASCSGSTIFLEGKKTEKGYEVQVKDQGCGIPSDEIARITEAFYMVDKSRARKEGGAGIGLTLCEGIIRLHHAKWQIESEKGKGTCVIIHFPETEDTNEEI